MCKGSVNKFLFRTIIFCLLFCAMSTEPQLLSENACYTQKNTIGTCINIMKCDPLLKLLKRKPRPPGSTEYLKNEHCGYEGLLPMVCCPQRSEALKIEADIKDRLKQTTEPPRRATNPSSQIDSSYSYYREYTPDIEDHPNLSLLSTNCGTLVEDRIFGGNKTGLFEFPWMALISFRKGRGQQFGCGGTIINNRYILTAAHCLHNQQVLGVRVGEHNIDEMDDCEVVGKNMVVCAPPYQDIAIEEIIVHPEYEGRSGTKNVFQNDIGLIRLKSSIDMNQENIQAICLPLNRDLQELRTDELRMTVAGWGVTENRISSPELLKITIPSFDNTQCSKIYKKWNITIGFRQMCAGGEYNMDSCRGDSGGPLMHQVTDADDVRVVEYGIVSIGPKECGKQGTPGVYTRIPHYMKWILDNLKE